MCAGGWTLFSFGLAGTGMGMMLCIIGDAVGAGGALIAVGGLMTGGGITLFTIGNKQRNKSFDIYNTRCESASANPISFNLATGNKSIVISMNF